METPPPTKPLDTSRDRVPEELIEKLHEANERFHKSREERERAVDDSQYRHQERIDLAVDHVRDAEKKVEGVTEEIRKILHPSGGPKPADEPRRHNDTKD